MGEWMVLKLGPVVLGTSQVYVKVQTVAGQKIGLTMRDVDQRTGEDLSMMSSAPGVPPRRPAFSAAGGSSGLPARPAPTFSSSGANSVPVGGFKDPMAPAPGRFDKEESRGRRPGKQISDYEKWELQQLVRTGALPAEEHPLWDEEFGLIYDGGDSDAEDVEIEVNDQVCW